MSHITDGDLHAYLDQALDAYAPAEAERIRAHLESCGDCAQRLDAERALRERATEILGGADSGTVPLASLEELEARAAATAGPTDRASKSRFSLRSPYAIGMGWAATIALALWTGYSVKDFAPNPSGRRSPPAVLEPRRELDAVSTDEQPAELETKADKFRVSEVEDAALRQLSSAGRVRGGDAGASASADAVAEPEQDQDFSLEEERRRRRVADAELPERIAAALRKEAARVGRPTAPASELFADVRANEAHRLSGTVIDAETGLPLAGAQVVVTGTNRGTLTNQDGRYVVSDVPAGQYELRAVVLGFSQQTKSITISDDRAVVADFDLSASAVQLDRITANVLDSEEQRARELGASNRQITNEDIPAASITSLEDVLAGRPEGLVLDGLRDSTDTGQKIGIGGADSISLANEPLLFVGGSVRVPDLEILRTDRVELPGMGQSTLIVQILPNGGDLELWSLTASSLAAPPPSIELEDRIAQITAYFRNSLPRGWSMAVLERPGGYLVARAQLPQAELDALMERVPEGD